MFIRRFSILLALTYILFSCWANTTEEESVSISSTLKSWNTNTDVFLKEGCHFPGLGIFKKHIFNNVRPKLVELLTLFADSKKIDYVIEFGDLNYTDEFIDVKLHTHDKKVISLRYLPDYNNLIFLGYTENRDYSSSPGCFKSDTTEINKISIISTWNNKGLTVETVHLY